MKLGLALPNNQGVERVMDLVHLAREAEDLGFSSVWVSEHLWHAEYVAKRLGDRPYHEPLTVLTAVAMVTRRVRLGTSVLIMPWHHPVRLAKTLASLDDLSEGRVDFGVGVAVTEDEFRNLGVPFGTRGRQTDDALTAMRKLWTEDVPEHHGEFYSFEGLRFEPKPRQAGGPPVLIGGGAPAALRRVVTHGDGWHALGQSPRRLGEALDGLRQAWTDAGRDALALKVSTRAVMEVLDSPFDRAAEDRPTLRGTRGEIVATVQAFADAGVQELVVDANTPDLGKVRATMHAAVELAAEVVPAV